MIAVESIGINVSGHRTLQCVKDVKQQIAVSRVRTLRYLFGAQIVRKSWTYKQNAHMKVCTSSDVAGRSLIVHNVLDPNFKRGPPKGYIQAIEHRLKLVETILGSIVASGDDKAQAIVENLRKDHLASSVLDRVHNGPYGLLAAKAAEEAASESPTSTFSSSVRTLGRANLRPNREPRTERELMSLDQGTSPIAHSNACLDNVHY